MVNKLNYEKNYSKLTFEHRSHIDVTKLNSQSKLINSIVKNLDMPQLPTISLECWETKRDNYIIRSVYLVLNVFNETKNYYLLTEAKRYENETDIFFHTNFNVTLWQPVLRILSGLNHVLIKKETKEVVAKQLKWFKLVYIVLKFIKEHLNSIYWNEFNKEKATDTIEHNLSIQERQILNLELKLKEIYV